MRRPTMCIPPVEHKGKYYNKKIKKAKYLGYDVCKKCENFREVVIHFGG